MTVFEQAPSPPFVELGFYDARRSDRELFQDVLDCLASRGATASGWGAGVRLEDGEPFIGPTDHEPIVVTVDRLDDVDDLLGPGLRLAEVDVFGALRYDPDRYARVTYLHVSVADQATDHRHPVAIWASGDAFSGPPQPATPVVGAEIRELFTAIVEWTAPSYGALTVSWPLLTPRQMASDPTVRWHYGDFYLSEAFVGAEVLRGVEQAAADLALEDRANGLFVYSYPPYGGTGRDHLAASSAFVDAISQRTLD